VLALLPALQKPTVASLSDPDWLDVNTIVEESVVRPSRRNCARPARGDRRVRDQQDHRLTVKAPDPGIDRVGDVVRRGVLVGDAWGGVFAVQFFGSAAGFADRVAGFAGVRRIVAGEFDSDSGIPRPRYPS
jgi:hypothetical protein